MDSKEIDSLVSSGRFASKSDVVRTALRVLLERNPEYRIDVAVELFRRNKVSLGRGAEIARMNREEFKEVLEERGIKKVLKPREGMEKRVESVEKK